jgi:uncharacterized protein YjbI with pentapeptide repeats
VPKAPEAIEWDDDAFEDALGKASKGVIDASGRRVSSQQLESLLAAAPRGPDRDRPLLTKVDFGRATFGGDAAFDGAIFSGDADFNGATFREDVDFRGTTFRKFAHFREATFAGEAAFGGVTFSGDTAFGGATFSGDADFGGATVTGGAAFRGATFGAVIFDGATFGGYADFSGATFSKQARFRGATLAFAKFDRATFRGDADLGRATFRGHAAFGRATFRGHADFGSATFRGATFGWAIFSEATFRRATFSGDAGFGGATFSGDADFGGATVTGDADFGSATFTGDAAFRGATFGGATFGETTFGGYAAFGGATFRRDADFHGATFERAKSFGPVHVFDRLWLDEVVFAERVRIEASALRASFARAEFRAGADLHLRWAELWLEDSVFVEPSLITGLQARLTPEGRKAFLGWEWPGDDGTWFRVEGDPPERFAPRVLSARGATVANLTLSGVNLERCRFAGTHGLDELQLERVDLPETPEEWQRSRPVRWTRRRIIAEEQQWRARREDAGWAWSEDPEPRPPQPAHIVEQSDPVVERSDAVAEESDTQLWPPERPGPLEPEEIAALYRRLRKGLEDSKNAPGANAFYYGEMELRRRHTAPLPERVILWLYWLFSGYGLRASRALVALAVTIAVGAILLDLWGFQTDRPYNGYGRALLFSLESSISLLRAPQAKLSAGGHVTQIVLRLAGPLFFGLALLALRGRVKR